VEEVYQFDDVAVHSSARRVVRSGEPLPIGSRALDLLLALLIRRERVVAKDELLALVWPGVVVAENNLTVQIAALRKLLGADAVVTVTGRGYRFARTVQVENALGRDVSSSGATAPTAVWPAAPTDQPSIAVLAFAVHSDDPAVTFLADGLVEDVIAQLARVPGFLVISRSSSLMFPRGQGNRPDIARQLGVRYLVEGSLRPADGRLLVSTLLVEAQTGHVLWSGTPESAADGSADLQLAIARGIISELEPALHRAEIQAIRRRHPDNIDAWGHYRRGVGAIALRGWNEVALTEARQSLERALTIDPGFALAAAQQSLVIGLGLATGLLADDTVLIDQALRRAEEALALEEGDSQVLGYVGCALADLGQLQRGAAVLAQALLLDPSNAQAQVAMGATQALLGHDDEGLVRMRIGMRLSPRDRRLGFWSWVLGLFLWRAGRADEALAEARLSAQRDPQLHLSRVLEATALLSLNRQAEATSAWAMARHLRSTLTLGEVERSHGTAVAHMLARLGESLKL